jgi:UDP-2-acetamido-3-amino-2,3-dideoxy-glucuronate N-acetyltransferase
MSAVNTKTPAIACVGAGYWGKNLVRNFAGLGALAAIVEADPASVANIQKSHPEVPVHSDIDAVLRDDSIQGVVIATPAETHASLVRRALLTGKDVFVEKPLCLNVEEGKQLAALARERGRVLMVGHLLWYHPAVLRLKELIQSGELGRIQYVYSNRLNLGKIRREENILWSFAPHDISVILGLLGEMPEIVYAQGGNYLHKGIADVTTSLLSFPSGTKAHVFVSWLHPFKEQKLVVVGDKRMAVFDDMATDKLTLYAHSIGWKDRVPTPEKAEGEVIALDAVEPLRQECQHFLDRIIDRATPRTDAEEALRVLFVLNQCQASMDSGFRVQVDREKLQVGRPPLPYAAHESAYIDDNVEIGEGTTIWHFSHVLKNSRIGKQCRIGQNVVIGPKAIIGDGVKIQNNVSVYEGVILEDHVFCGPSMVFTNVYNPRSEIRRMDEIRTTLVRRGASLGANCTVVCGTTIGQYAFIGAGAVVHRNVPDYALIVGNPGRIIGFVCRCGNRIDFDGEAGKCRACESAYRKSGDVVSPVEAS